jgi:hypothetical protein
MNPDRMALIQLDQFLFCPKAAMTARIPESS